MRIQGTSGSPEVLTKLDTKKREAGHVYPQFLPGGKILFTVRTVGDF